MRNRGPSIRHYGAGALDDGRLMGVTVTGRQHLGRGRRPAPRARAARPARDRRLDHAAHDLRQPQRLNPDDRRQGVGSDPRQERGNGLSTRSPQGADQIANLPGTLATNRPGCAPEPSSRHYDDPAINDLAVQFNASSSQARDETAAGGAPIRQCNCRVRIAVMRLVGSRIGHFLHKRIIIPYYLML